LQSEGFFEDCGGNIVLERVSYSLTSSCLLKHPRHASLGELDGKTLSAVWLLGVRDFALERLNDQETGSRQEDTCQSWCLDGTEIMFPLLSADALRRDPMGR